MTFGNKLKKARTKKGYKQKDVARVLNVGLSVISNWENDTNKPDVEKIEILCGLFDIEPNYLFNCNQVTVDTDKIYNPLDDHEQKVITAYRKKTEMQPAVDKLLGIEDEEKKLPKISDTYKTGYATIAADEGGVEKVERDKDLKSISDYYD